jgi:putative endonuclease
MPLFARAVFGVVNWLAARRGLAPEAAGEADARHLTGMRGETYAYWYLRRQGYTIVRRNYRTPHRRGEIDLIGWDGPVLAFVEVKTRTTETGGPPERTVDASKQQELVQMARDYLARRQLADVPTRFDVLALEAKPGAAPLVRLHKGAFGA